ncbi:hypothetical protein FRC12_009889 [Ceratobasidium sp. 428]|nr:hypothetical protein FRC12_009889 [Ceratobasidium sp. 428]
MDPETVERAVKRATTSDSRSTWERLSSVTATNVIRLRITSGAGPSSSRHVLSPPPLPLGVNKVDKYPDDQYNPDHALDLDDELGDDKLEKNELEHDDMVNSGAHAAKSGAGPISHSTSQTRAQSRSQTCSLSRSPARPHADFPNQQLHSPSRSRSRTRSSTGPGDAPDFRLVNHEEDAAFYANLLEDNNLARPPPFGVGNGSEASEEEGGRGGDHEEEGEGGERGDDGSDDGDGEPDLGQNQAPGQREPAIFVPQEFGDNPGDPDDEHVGPMAFAEDPVLRNIYLRTWVQAAFHGATHNAIQAMLESHKLTLQATANLRPQELVEEVEKMPTTLRSLERRLSINFSDLIIIFVMT